MDSFTMYLIELLFSFDEKQNINIIRIYIYIYISFISKKQYIETDLRSHG